MKLGVNIDHVATVRQARGTRYPDPVHAALLAEQAGADIITLHLREDRRHIQDRDVQLLGQLLQTRMNLEMAATEEMLAIASDIRPADCCLVPERREELTTEGGLDVAAQIEAMTRACGILHEQSIRVSLFIDPDPVQLDAARAAGAGVVELHTGAYADAPDEPSAGRELQRIVSAAAYASRIGLEVHAGHGLHYHNLAPIAVIAEVVELHIGHAIIARAVFDGIQKAVREIKGLILEARGR